MALTEEEAIELELLELEEEELSILSRGGRAPSIPDRSDEPFEIEMAQFGAEVGPAVPRTPEEIEAAGEFDLPVGAMAGGTAGAILGGGTPLSIPLSALGAAGGEALEQLVRHGLRGLGFDVDVPETSTEAAKKIGIEFGLGGIGEGIGQGVVRGGGEAIKRLAPKLRPGAERIVKTLRPFFPEGKPPLLPANVTESTIIDFAQSIAETGIGSSGKIVRAKQLTDDIVTNLIDDVTTGLTGGAKPLETGALVLDAVEGGTKAFSNAGRGLYRVVDDLTTAQTRRGVGAQLTVTDELINGVDLTSAKALARNLLETAKKGIRTAEQTKVLDDIVARPNIVPFEDAHILRSDLLNVGRSGTEIVKGKAAGSAKKLSGAVDEAMETAAKGFEGDALTAWRTANKFWKGGKETFNSTFVKGLMRANPEAALNMAIQAGKPSNIAALRGVMFDSKILSPEQLAKNADIWKNMQGQFAEKITRGAVSDEIEGTLRGSNILKAIRKARAEGTFGAIAPGGELDFFEDLAKALTLNQAKQPGGKTARVLLAMIQGGAAARMVFKGETDAPSLAIIFGPRMLADALTSRTLSRLLIDGMQSKGTIAELTRLATRIAATAQRDNIDLDVTLGGEKIEPTERQEAPPAVIDITPGGFSVAPRRGLTSTPQGAL